MEAICADANHGNIFLSGHKTGPRQGKSRTYRYVTPVIVDCHVNLWEPQHVRPLFTAGTAYSPPGSVSPMSPIRIPVSMPPWRGFDRAIVFSLRYADSAGIDGDDEDNRPGGTRNTRTSSWASQPWIRAGSDYMELLRRAVEEYGLKER